eukprot:530521-Hanusia_phi.AAC.1
MDEEEMNEIKVHRPPLLSSLPPCLLVNHPLCSAFSQLFFVSSVSSNNLTSSPHLPPYPILVSCLFFDYHWPSLSSFSLLCSL